MSAAVESHTDGHKDSGEGSESTKRVLHHHSIAADYDLDPKPFAHGISGKVYSGVDRVSGESVAVKQMSYRGASAAAERAKLKVARLEVSILLRIREECPHPSLMRLIAVYIDERSKTLFIVMPRYQGGELFDRIVQTAGFSEELARKVFHAIVSAVQRLHQAGIVHRDLKPENILLADEDPTSVVITDFGLSKLKGVTDIHEAHAIGTLSYIAPEVLSEQSFTPACDVWGLGVILYVLLSGLPPFYGDEEGTTWEQRVRNEKQITARTLAGQFYFFEEYFATISPEAKDVISRCLAVDPSRRITLSQLLEHPWLAKVQCSDALPKTRRHLARFNARRKFRVAIHTALVGSVFNIRRDLSASVAATNLTRHEVGVLRRAFLRVSPSGGVTKEQFVTVMNALGFQLADLPVERMFHLCDKDGDGRVEYRELLSALSSIKARDMSTLKLVFAIYDEDNSNSISRKEFARVLACTNLADAAPHEARERAVDLFDKVDADHNNSISFEEIVAGVRSIPELAELLLVPLTSDMDSEHKWSLPAATPRPSAVATAAPEPAAAVDKLEPDTLLHLASGVRQRVASRGGAGTGAGSGAGAGAAGGGTGGGAESGNATGEGSVTVGTGGESGAGAASRSRAEVATSKLEGGIQRGGQAFITPVSDTLQMWHVALVAVVAFGLGWYTRLATEES